MKKTINRNFIKRISLILLIVLFCSFLVPMFSFAVIIPPGMPGMRDDEKAENKSLFSPIASFFCAVGDITLGILQENLVGTRTLKYTGDDSYSLKYSPGIIFSGDLPLFDINFINPMEKSNKYEVKEKEKIIESRQTATIAVGVAGDDGAFDNLLDTEDVDVIYFTQDSIDTLSGVQSSIKEVVELMEKNPNHFENKYTFKEGKDLVRKRDVTSYVQSLLESHDFFNEETEEKMYTEDVDYKEEFTQVASWLSKSGEEYNLYRVYVNHGINDSLFSDYSYRIYSVKLTKTVLEKSSTLTSVASIMRQTIATWYKVMQEIALVGLLLVLIYVAIRSIISGSATDKAKYKKMLLDWLTAVIIVITLHYIISFTFAVINAVSDIFNVNIVDESGNDIIFSKLRTDVGSSENFKQTLTKLVMYYCLVILTIKYTIQYFKRFIYVAFLTMIGPIIGLTYPLDKIKDGQAQAFSLWIKEFLFNALIQPFHLILYYVFIGSSVMSTFANENPLYALVVLAFLPSAEKILRKMFGFDKGGNLGNMEAAFGGAAVMNMINNLGSGSSKGGSAGNGSAGNSNTPPMSETPVRTVSNNDSAAYESLRRPNIQPEDSSSGSGGADYTTSTNKGISTRGFSRRGTSGVGTAGGINTTNQSSTGTNQSKIGKMLGRKPQGRTDAENSKSGVSRSSGGRVRTSLRLAKNKIKETYNKPTIKGIRAVGGKVFTGSAKLVGTGLVKGLVRGTGIVAGGVLGVAYGLSTGEEEKIFGGLVGGATLGDRLAKSTISTASYAKNSVSRVANDIRETYEQGSLGEEQAQREKNSREFRKTRDYKDLLERFPENQEKIQKLVNAGITDASKIRIAIENNYSTDNTIAYMHMAKACPNNIFEDRKKFIIYLESHGIPKENADVIYKAVRNFK